jgi:hypothetical protein
MRLASFGKRKIWLSTVPEMTSGMLGNCEVDCQGLDKQRPTRLSTISYLNEEKVHFLQRQ